MKAIVNIECPIGLDKSQECIDYVLAILHVDKCCCNLTSEHNGSMFWMLDNVDEETYDSNIQKIYDRFNSLYHSGYIQYFYIGKCN